jgi:hypothetical protein
MRFLKIIVLVSFLLINGLGPHGIPNFAGILICLNQFIIDIFNSFSHEYEISWILGLVGISSITSILMILLSKKYRDRYLLMIALAVLLSCEIFLSDILHYQAITSWFIFPLIVFILSSVVLITKNFQGKSEFGSTN